MPLTANRKVFASCERGADVVAHDDVPGRAVALVKLALDVRRDHAVVAVRQRVERLLHDRARRGDAARALADASRSSNDLPLTDCAVPSLFTL